VVVKGDLGFAMCVVPACKRLDLTLVAEVLQSVDVRLATELEMTRLFPECELGAEPPIGALFGLKTIVDSRLHEQDYVIMQAGSHTSALEIRRSDWERLCNPIVAEIACP
jgi:Ala-tRNA(Pro) deacylase